MKTVKIYTTPSCGICKMAKKKMMDKNIPYEEYDLIDYANILDSYSAPVLQLEDGSLLKSPIEINDWINQQ